MGDDFVSLVEFAQIISIKIAMKDKSTKQISTNPITIAV